MLRSIARALLLRRLMEGSRHSRRSSGRYASGRGGGRRRSSGGFGMRGPFPSYSRRTRGGSRVSVTGCCLPIPLGIMLTPVAAYAAHRRATTR